MNKFTSKRSITGAVFQAGIPFVDPTDGTDAPFLVRGVVMRYTAIDDPQHPFSNQSPSALFVDCLVYTQLTGGRFYWVKGCLVSQEGGGMHKGQIWRPRVTSQQSSTQAQAPDNLVDVSQLDGDHVLIGFIDNRRYQPIILRGLPHPIADKGNEDKPIGKRTRLRTADGNTDLSKFNGVFRGVDNQGNHVIDTTMGNTGKITAQGLEVPGTPGVSGNQTNVAPSGASIYQSIVEPLVGTSLAKHELNQGALNVTFSGSPGAVNIINSAGPLVGVTIGAGGNGNVVLGNGNKLLVDADKLAAFITAQIVAIFNQHVHVTGAPGSPTSTPVLPFAPPAAPPPSFMTAVVPAVVAAAVANNSVKVPSS